MLQLLRVAALRMAAASLHAPLLCTPPPVCAARSPAVRGDGALHVQWEVDARDALPAPLAAGLDK